MKTFLKITVVAFYLTSALCSDWGHSHLSPFSFDRIGGIFNHDCSTNEIHKPLDAINFCFICYQLSTSNSLLNSFDSNSLLQNVSRVSISIIGNPTFGYEFQPVGRAPPQFS